MNMAQVLSRIDARMAELGLKAAEVSRRADGSADLIRNWRRAVADGKTLNPRTDTLAGVATALGVTLAYLTGDDAAAAPGPGFADHAAPFHFSQTAAQRPGSPAETEPDAAIRALYAHAGRNPAQMRVLVSLPVLSMLAGDVIVMDLSRLPVPGEIAVVTILDEDAAQSSTRLCIYAPPLLIPGDQSATSPHFRVDDAAVMVRHPVVGCLRGIVTAV